jgi:hypothetical protein
MARKPVAARELVEVRTSVNAAIEVLDAETFGRRRLCDER